MSHPKPTRSSFVDLEGQRFGRLVVVEHAEPIRKGNSFATAWLCRCDCGNEKIVLAAYLKGGGTTSCGCYRSERTRARSKAVNRVHGATFDGRRPPEYSAWVNMKGRCRNPDNWCYERYGARGIGVCECYAASFEAFLRDLGKRPSPAHSIDRRDNNGNYSCGRCPQCVENGWEFNVRWATKKQQSNNRRVTPFYTHDGRTLSLADWADAIGLAYVTLRTRIQRGWSIADALTRPVQPRTSR